MMPDQAERIGQLSRSPVLRAWLASRAVVLAALLAAVLIHPQTRASLLSWDAAWYRDIAAHGYLGAPRGGVRFFPVWPLAGRVVGGALGAPPGAVLVVLADLAALLYLHLARRVALAEGLLAASDRVPFVVAFAPAGAVLVMGYTEALYGVLLCAVFLTARHSRWWPCAAAGLVIGALRPTGVVLALPVAIEACRGLREAPPRELGARLGAVLAPGVGLACYLSWAWTTYGDALAPFHAQLEPSLRGAAFVNPLHTLAAVPSAHGTRLLGLLLNLAVLVVGFALLRGCARLLPTSYTVFSAITLLLAVTARDFSSAERYTCSALPLLLVAAALLAERPHHARWTLCAAATILFGQALLTFASWYLP